MKPTTFIAIWLAGSMLGACGGGGDATVTSDTSAAPIIRVPLAGYNQDGTIPPAGEQPGNGEPLAGGEQPTQDGEGSDAACRAPQASEQGVEHGKPPVGRCA